jgi:hypothetical protein
MMFVNCTLTKYYCVDHINKDMMGGACSMNVEEENSYRVLGGSLKERGHFET